MTTPTILKLESFTQVAPLALRFHDTASGEFVRDGLNVSAYPTGKSESRTHTSLYFILTHLNTKRSMLRIAFR